MKPIRSDVQLFKLGTVVGNEDQAAVVVCEAFRLIQVEGLERGELLKKVGDGKGYITEVDKVQYLPPMYRKPT